MTDEDISKILVAIGDIKADINHRFENVSQRFDTIDSKLRRMDGDLKTAAHERAQIKAVIVDNAEGIQIRIDELQRFLTEMIEDHTKDALAHSR